MKCAYLVNMYPAPSHTTMRREVDALRAEGIEVAEFAVRAFPGTLVEPEDRVALTRTVVIRTSALASLSCVAIAATSRPLRFFRALCSAVRCGASSRRGVLRHIANLADACVLLRNARHCDILHAHFSTATTIATLTRILGGPPTSLGLHGPEEFIEFSEWEWNWKAKHTILFAAVCEDTARKAQSHLSREHHHKVTVIRCGLDDAFLDTTTTPIPDSRHFVCIARLEDRKRHDRLLRAFRRAKERFPDATLTLIGDGPLRAQVQALATRDSGVTLLGWGSHTDVKHEIERSRCTVLASDAEGLPIVYMESFALARPVIATDAGGTRELVRHGQTGWLIARDAMTEQHIEDSLTLALEEACATAPESRFALGMNGKQATLERHRTRTNIQALVTKWRALLKSDAQ